MSSSKAPSRFWEIKARSYWFDFNFAELYSYRDLLFRLVRKEFISSYQQTLLGPLWVVLQPLISVLTYVIVFDQIIGLSTQGVPSFIYYLSGITLWNLFSETFLSVAYTFAQNGAIFSKVYFPRLISPLAMLLVNFTKFLIQFSLLIIVSIYYAIWRDVNFDISRVYYCIPAVLLSGGIAFGSGLIFAVITTKYKDLFGLLQLLIRLLMFISPVLYSVALVPSKVKAIVDFNPLTSQFEMFRYGFFGIGEFSSLQVGYSVLVFIIATVGGVILFNKAGDKLMDVI